MEKGDILNASQLADISWKSPNSCILLRTSDPDEDASYLRLSLGQFFGQRSEALGCLGGGSDVKRVRVLMIIPRPREEARTTTASTTFVFYIVTSSF